MDPYQAAAWLTFLRIPLAFLMLIYISRTKIRQLYVMTASLVCLGSLTVASKLLVRLELTRMLGATVTSWIPVAGLTMMYAGKIFSYIYL